MSAGGHPRDFPPDFLFGTATAAAQIEGGEVPSSWDRWSTTPGKIKDGTTSRRGCDHWNRVDQDIALQKELGCTTYRFGLEWARIEPRECEWDYGALDHYREEIQKLLSVGIRPLVTLHHFANPLWLEDRDGWMNPHAPVWFVRYVDMVVRYLGDLVTDWVTINEPNIYLVKGWQFGEWPPGLTGRADLVIKGARHFLEAHAQAYITIHRVRKEKGWPGKTLVGAAHHLRVFQPEGGPVAAFSAALQERIFQGMFLEGMSKGRLVLPLGRGYPWGREALSDFVGINYYSRDIIKGRLRSVPTFGEIQVHPTNPRNDLGWEIYPEGLAILCRQVWKKYRLPIFITENGTADARDSFRSKFLTDHLAALAQVRKEGVDVQRYYHWTLTDNFEWAEGESARFGLVETDFETQKRTIRPSGRLFARIARTGSLDPGEGAG